ncbi:Na+/H+ antiporter subunit B [Thermus sediminis]|uniref:Na+/H+ antiporter subunit B n=1 Tax=Thermus sediminis TaxID=1761908 RepID=UPI000E3C66E1|nr:Na+/H+ antiporter subunit B [Thermus sediminis]
MNSLILRTASLFLVPLMFLFSLFLLFRGHNEPGGGFVGGLVAVGSFVLYAMAYGLAEARRALRVSPVTLVAWGIFLAFVSGLLAALYGTPYLTGYWLEYPLPGGLKLKVGTPTLFDIGVFLVVVGSILTMIFALEEE